MELEAKKPKILVEKIEILDESTGQIILKEQARLVYTSHKSDNDTDSEQLNRDSIIIEDYDDSSDTLSLTHKNSNLHSLNSDIDYPGNTTIQLFDDSNNNLDILGTKNSHKKTDESFLNHAMTNNNQRIIIIDTGSQSDHQQAYTPIETSKKSLLNSGLSAHIVQNYSILAQEITAPLDTSKILSHELYSNQSQPTSSKQWSNRSKDFKLKDQHTDDSRSPTSSTSSSAAGSFRAQKDMATCQFCGRAMLKKNIPTHIRRAHTPKEELVCLNEEQNIFTFQHLKPGQRRKRSARAYDYSLMTATVSIDEDPCEGIENKFITEGEEILSTDLLQLADRIKYGISQIPNSTLTKLIDILAKIEYSTQDEISANAKSIRNMICFYLTSGEEFKYKVRQVGEDIVEKKKQVNNLRADLKEIMARKAQLERRIQPLIVELQKLEDQHGNLIESKGSDELQFEIISTNDTNESVN